MSCEGSFLAAFSAAPRAKEKGDRRQPQQGHKLQPDQSSREGHEGRKDFQRPGDYILPALFSAHLFLIVPPSLSLTSRGRSEPGALTNKIVCSRHCRASRTKYSWSSCTHTHIHTQSNYLRRAARRTLSQVSVYSPLAGEGGGETPRWPEKIDPPFGCFDSKAMCKLWYEFATPRDYPA